MSTNHCTSVVRSCDCLKPFLASCVPAISFTNNLYYFIQLISSQCSYEKRYNTITCLACLNGLLSTQTNLTHRTISKKTTQKSKKNEKAILIITEDPVCVLVCKTSRAHHHYHKFMFLYTTAMMITMMTSFQAI